KEFSDHLYHSMRLPLMRAAGLKLESKPGESESAFQQRIALILREKREMEAGKLEESYQKKQRRLEVRLDKAYARIDKEKTDVTAKGMDTALSFGVAVFGALFGRKPFSVTTASRSARGMRSAGRLMKEKGDVKRAAETAAMLEEDLAALAVELQDKMSIVARRFDPAQYAVETFSINPRRADIFNERVCLLWEPVFDFSALE
ncbi:MAG: hypothetical protein GQ559_06620, partial [Desulfobulbaceae bacterium]|nr:hypothetical protein [Desulfobulbaceae bacterium]